MKLLVLIFDIIVVLWFIFLILIFFIIIYGFLLAHRERAASALRAESESAGFGQ